MKLRYTEFPEEIRVENTNFCNAHCAMCPREKLSRPKGTMSLENFQKIVDQCDPDRLKDLHLQGFGEPLVDQSFLDKIRYARTKLPRTRLLFVTNASLLTGELAKQIILSRVDKIKVSFYGVSELEYENVHQPLLYRKIKRNIVEFVRLKRELHAQKPVLSVKYIGAWHNFPLFAWQWLGTARIEFSHLHNYGTGRAYNSPKRKRWPVCPMVGNPILQILWNGDVVPCCYDFNGEYILGNVLEQGLTAVWTGEKYQKLRNRNREYQITQISMCKQCDKVT